MPNCRPIGKEGLVAEPLPPTPTRGADGAGADADRRRGAAEGTIRAQLLPRPHGTRWRTVSDDPREPERPACARRRRCGAELDAVKSILQQQLLRIFKTTQRVYPRLRTSSARPRSAVHRPRRQCRKSRDQEHCPHKLTPAQQSSFPTALGLSITGVDDSTFSVTGDSYRDRGRMRTRTRRCCRGRPRGAARIQPLFSRLILTTVAYVCAAYEFVGGFTLTTLNDALTTSRFFRPASLWVYGGEPLRGRTHSLYNNDYVDSTLSLRALFQIHEVTQRRFCLVAADHPLVVRCFHPRTFCALQRPH